MLKKYFPLVIFLYLIVLGNIYAQTLIPDANFEQALIDLGIDTDGTVNGSVATADISGVINLDVHWKQIKNLTGIEGFSNLRTLECSSNQLTSLNLSENDSLRDLRCNSNDLTSLDISKCSKLKILISNYNDLHSLNVDNNKDLELLDIGEGNRIGYFGNILNLSNNKKLKILRCGSNGLEELKVDENTVLEELNCERNRLNSLDVSTNTSLEFLRFGNNQIKNIELTFNIALRYLDCSSNLLTRLDLISNINLISIRCSNNQLTGLDVSNNKLLWEIYCGNNSLKSLNVKNGNNSNITYCYSTDNPFLTCIRVDNAANANAGIAPYKFWQKDGIATYSEDCVQIITVFDSNFEQALIDLGIDTDGDVNGNITTNNISEITSLDLSESGITDLRGIGDFFNLETLNVSGNQLESLDVSNNTALKNLDCSNNQLTGILDLSDNLSLLDINVSNNPNLIEIILPIYLAKNKILKSLQVNSAQFSTQFSYNNLINLNFAQTSLTNIDVFNFPNLVTLNAQGSKLTSIDVSNNSILSVLNLTNNPLACIQVSQEQLDNIPTGWEVDATAAYSTDCENYLGVDDELLTEGLNLYPNPVSDMLTVDSKLPLSKVEIYSILGQRVKEIDTNLNSISLNNLSNGIYIVRIYSENGTTVRKLIKK